MNHNFISMPILCFRLTPVEYTKLVGNLDDILAFQNNFLSSIEDCMK